MQAIMLDGYTDEWDVASAMEAFTHYSLSESNS